MSEPSTEKAQVQLVQSNSDRHPAGHVGGNSIYDRVRIECPNGTVVYVGPDGSVTTLTARQDREERYARFRPTSPAMPGYSSDPEIESFRPERGDA